MQSANKPDNEQDRLAWLRELDILDTVEEQVYDDLSFLAAQICGTSIALISLVDDDRQWFKSHLGLDARETPRDLAFCAHAILDDDVFIVEDSTEDARFSDNPLVTGPTDVKFYAGAPLILRDSIRVGTLCVIDNSPRSLTDDQINTLQALARQVVSQMELRLTIKELRHLDFAKNAFVSTVSHELRTPLTAINGALGLIQHQLMQGEASANTDQLNNLADVAHRNSQRLLHLVNDILDLARLDAGKFTLDQSDVPVSQIVTQATSLNQVYIESFSCTVKTQLLGIDSVETVWCDEERLLQILSNLLSNASKFTTPGDEILLKVESGPNIKFSVINHGPCIPEDQQRFLFDRFYQVSGTSNHKTPGTGLGLSICKQLVELHGGSMGFESIAGESTCFWFTIPTIDPAQIIDQDQ